MPGLDVGARSRGHAPPVHLPRHVLDFHHPRRLCSRPRSPPSLPDEVQGERAVHEERVAVHAANVGIGTDWGLWGEGFAQSVHLDVPLFGNRQGALGFRAWIIVYDPPTSNRFDPR